MDDSLLFLQNLIISLLLGGLIGLEREKNRKDEGLHEFGGIRTMAMISVFAYLIHTLFADLPALFGVFVAGFFGLVLASYVLSSLLNKNTGATTEVAAFFVFLVGVLMSLGELLFASVVTLLVLLLLYCKEPLHRFAHTVSKEEMYDTVKFVAIAFVVLPLLPNEVFGPLEVLNPYTIWLVVVLVSSISFVSYIAIKLLGQKKGIGISGFLGGLISSTAVAMSFAGLSKKTKSLVIPFVFGILVASSAMFFRVLLEVSVINPALISALIVPLSAMGGAGALISLYFWLQHDKKMKQITENQLSLQDPFKLWVAVQFGLLFAALLFVSKAANLYFGEEGLYLTALISGLADVDAITISMANLHKSGDISMEAASISIVIATVVNTLVKGVIVMLFGSKAVGRRVLASLVLVVIVGVLSLLLTNPSIYGFIAI